MNHQRAYFRKIKLSVLTFIFGLLFLTSSTIHGQTITGFILDEKTGDPLIGANVILKGTNSGSVTDSDGLFQMDLKDENAIISVSYLGYKTQEIEITDKSAPQEIKMIANEIIINGVTIVGYQRKRRGCCCCCHGYSYSNVKGVQWEAFGGLEVGNRPESNILCYPNPTRDFIQIKDAQIGSTYYVYNSVGKLMQGVHVKSLPLQIDLSSYASGTYVISTLINGHLESEQVVLVK